MRGLDLWAGAGHSLQNQVGLQPLLGTLCGNHYICLLSTSYILIIILISLHECLLYW